MALRAAAPTFRPLADDGVTVLNVIGDSLVEFFSHLFIYGWFDDPKTLTFNRNEALAERARGHGMLLAIAGGSALRHRISPPVTPRAAQQEVTRILQSMLPQMRPEVAKQAAAILLPEMLDTYRSSGRIMELGWMYELGAKVPLSDEQLDLLQDKFRAHPSMGVDALLRQTREEAVVLTDQHATGAYEMRPGSELTAAERAYRGVRKEVALAIRWSEFARLPADLRAIMMHAIDRHPGTALETYAVILRPSFWRLDHDQQRNLLELADARNGARGAYRWHTLWPGLVARLVAARPEMANRLLRFLRDVPDFGNTSEGERDFDFARACFLATDLPDLPMAELEAVLKTVPLTAGRDAFTVGLDRQRTHRELHQGVWAKPPPHVPSDLPPEAPYVAVPDVPGEDR